MSAGRPLVSCNTTTSDEVASLTTCLIFRLWRLRVTSSKPMPPNNDAEFHVQKRALPANGRARCTISACNGCGRAGSYDSSASTAVFAVTGNAGRNVKDVTRTASPSSFHSASSHGTTSSVLSFTT